MRENNEVLLQMSPFACRYFIPFESNLSVNTNKFHEKINDQFLNEYHSSDIAETF